VAGGADDAADAADAGEISSFIPREKEKRQGADPLSNLLGTEMKFVMFI
jgi:hypothetical protein